MTEHRLADYLSPIQQAAGDALAFTEGMPKADFLADKRTQQASIMSLVIIGEVAARVLDRHPAFAARHPEVPWRSIRGMRNRIAHGYSDINLDVVRETVQTALPGLLRALGAIDLEVDS